MKHIVWVFAFFFSLNGYSQLEIKATEARDHVGDTVKICTRVFSGTNETSQSNSTYLYAGADGADAPLTIVIRNENRRYFDYKPEKDLKDRDVCITGRIELFKDKAQIIVSKQAQIEIKQ